jgi:hypothetical protein
MFQDLDDTLKNLLNWVVPAQPPPDLAPTLGTSAPQGLRDAAKLFLTPDRSFSARLNGQTTVDLFLHQIQENLELRETQGFATFNQNPIQSPLPLMRVDCSYLVTTWSVTNGEQQVSAEHELLGLALQWLGRFRTIPTAVFSRAFATSNDALPLPYAIAANVDPNRISVDFWTALGIAPRPSFDLTVTVAIDFAVRVADGPPVISRELDLKLIEPPPEPPVLVAQLFSIGGTVTSSAAPGQPLFGASVGLASRPRALDQKTGADGTFRLDDLAAGTYLLRASSGARTRTKEIIVPANSAHAYDVVV